MENFQLTFFLNKMFIFPLNFNLLSQSHVFLRNTLTNYHNDIVLVF